MATKIPLALYSGKVSELQSGDALAYLTETQANGLYIKQDGTTALTGAWDWGKYVMYSTSAKASIGIGVSPSYPLHIQQERAGDWASYILNTSSDRGSNGLYIKTTASRATGLQVDIDTTKHLLVSDAGVYCSGVISPTHTSATGAISFDNENLSTTGTLSAGLTTVAGLVVNTVQADINMNVDIDYSGSLYALDVLNSGNVAGYDGAYIKATNVSSSTNALAVYQGSHLSLQIKGDGTSAGDIYLDGTTLWVDSSANKVLIGTSGVSSPYETGQALETYNALSGNNKISYTFNSLLGSGMSGINNYQFVGGMGGSSSGLSAGNTAGGWYGLVNDDGTSTGGHLTAIDAYVQQGASQTANCLTTYRSVVANKAATANVGLLINPTQLGSGASINYCTGIYIYEDTAGSLANYAIQSNGVIKIIAGTGSLVIPVVSTLPATKLEDGYLIGYENGATRRLYIRMSSTWRYVNLT